jgi:protein SCO1/2
VLRTWLVAALIAAALVACSKQAALPVIADAPPLPLIDQAGQPFASKRVAGKVWIANFMFTSCPDVCPLLTSKMRSLQLRFGNHKRDIELVSISVDPHHDTPAALATFAREHEADLSNWSFLTGPDADVRQVVMEGFKQAMEEVPAKDDQPRNILHGTHVTLIDRRGRIRGFYRTDNPSLLKLTQDAQQLLKETP